MKFYSVGNRPKCLFCGKELAPQFKTTSVPYELWQDAEKKAQFKADNPNNSLANTGAMAITNFVALLAVGNGKFATHQHQLKVNHEK